MIRPWKAVAFAGLSILVLAFSATASEYVPGEVIVKFKEDSLRLQSSVQLMHQQVGVEYVDYFDQGDGSLEHWYLQEGVSVEQAMQQIQEFEEVEYVQPNYVLSIPQPVNALVEPCIIPGIPFPPGCEDGGGGNPGNPGESPFPPGLPCIIPGIPFPPGCEDGGGGNPGNPGNPGGQRPPVGERPADVNPPVDDPDNSKAWGLEKIGATVSWAEAPGSQEIVVAVIDTGVDYNHKDIAFNMWRNPNPKNNDIVGFNYIHNDGLPFDDQGHGTHTAGTVGATGKNGIGVSGVASRVSIMALKFLDKGGRGVTTNAIKAIDYSIENGAKISSNSWGGPADPNNRALGEAIQRAMDAGQLFVAAAGNSSGDNDGRSKMFPASFENENIIAVAATDKDDKMAFFSNYGKTSVDLAAPGVNVYSLAPGDKYATHSGTSMACPHVAGAAAVVWSANPSWDWRKVKEALLSSATKVPGLETKTLTGARLNLKAALAHQ